MRAAYVLCLILAAVSSHPQDITNEAYMNVDAMRENERLLMISYINCIQNQDDCSTEREKIKSHMKEALDNFCPKCTDDERERIRQVLAQMDHNGPDYWKQQMPTLMKIKSQWFSGGSL